MEYTILGFLIVLAGLLFFIYKKIDGNKNSDEITSKYAVLAEKIDNLATITDTFRDNLNKIQTELSDKLTQKQTSSEKSLTEDKKIANKK